MIEFVVIDHTTGREADLSTIENEAWVRGYRAIHFKWERHYRFALLPNGGMILLGDDTHHWIPCPEERFSIRGLTI